MHKYWEYVGSQSNQNGLIFDYLHIQHYSRPQDYFQNEVHHENKKSHFIDFFEKKVQENSNSHLEAEIEDEIINKDPQSMDSLSKDALSQDEGRNHREQMIYSDSLDGLNQSKEFDQGGSGNQVGSEKQAGIENRETSLELRFREGKGKRKIILEEDREKQEVNQNKKEMITPAYKKWAHIKSISRLTNIPHGRIDDSFIEVYTRKFHKELNNELSNYSSESNSSNRF
ncbi:hypothetical protein PCANC_02404 [Puccinia coronata f. sp. avenae]|uniref:Uncharacterized protein n=1 Tax=Puccinia coronata f. sp. avenae TaxID=200324 RepID=A0A2N5W4Y6_9BASI|nr:hypothetical protein PCANC_02404 [Puccinia coronata f. sp. avenae]